MTPSYLGVGSPAVKLAAKQLPARSPKLASARAAAGSKDPLLPRVLMSSAEEPGGGQGAAQAPPDLKRVVQRRSELLRAVAPSRPLVVQPADGTGQSMVGLRRVAQFVSETFLVARLAFKLAGYVGFGWRWISSFLALLAYAALLMPGFLQMVGFYFLSARIKRSVRYGPQSRNVLDIYVPPAGTLTAAVQSAGGLPVLVYVTGGAWTIGYKAWGALLSRRLSAAGVLVFCLDYRNFPQGTAIDMLEDLNHGIGWVLANAQLYGGDPSQVFLCGQSCGGHLASLAVLTQAEQQALGQAVPGGSPAWDVTRVRGFIGVSGVYNVCDLVEHFDRRGLYKSLFLKIMSIHDEPQLKLLSPVYVAEHSLRQAQRGQQAQQAAVAHGIGIAIPASDSCTSVGPLGSEERELAISRSSSSLGGGEAGEGEPLLVSAGSGELVEVETGLHWAGKEDLGSPAVAVGTARGPLLHAESAAALHIDGGSSSSSGAAKRRPAAPFHGSSASSLIGAAWGGRGRPAAAAAAAAWEAQEEGGGQEGPLLEVAGAAGGGGSPVDLMPHMLLLHGDADRCAPVEGAEQFAHALRESGCSVELKLYGGETHTSPLLENPMRGGRDQLTDDVLTLIRGSPQAHSYPPLCPHFLIRLASAVCPF